MLDLAAPLADHLLLRFEPDTLEVGVVEHLEDGVHVFVELLDPPLLKTMHEFQTTAPEQRLELLLDKLLVAPEDHHDLLIAMLEMQSQAPYKEAFADRFQQNDEYVQYLLRTVIDHGISEDTFSDVDSEHVARAFMTIVDGGRTRASFWTRLKRSQRPDEPRTNT